MAGGQNCIRCSKEQEPPPRKLTQKWNKTQYVLALSAQTKAFHARPALKLANGKQLKTLSMTTCSWQCDSSLMASMKCWRHQISFRHDTFIAPNCKRHTWLSQSGLFVHISKKKKKIRSESLTECAGVFQCVSCRAAYRLFLSRILSSLLSLKATYRPPPS